MTRIPLPMMRCDPDCGRCCGIVACNEQEYKEIANYAAKHSITPLAQGDRCPWYQGGKCAVYDVRPMACQLFGHIAAMPCPLGYNVNVSKNTEHRLTRQYRQKCSKMRYLHEILLEQKKITVKEYLEIIEPIKHE